MNASRPPRDLPLNAGTTAFFGAVLSLCLFLSARQTFAGYANGDTRGANLLGAVPNVVSVDPTAGSAGMAYTLEVPPGRAGLQPELVLSYSSGGSEPGPLGRGWSLLLPSIRRLTDSSRAGT